MKQLNSQPILGNKLGYKKKIIESEILKLQKDILETSDDDKIESIQKITEKNNALEKITEERIQGLILRSKAEMVENGERNSKYFASLEKKRSETKPISRLKINNKINTNQTEILSETELFYKNLYNKWEVGHSSYNCFEDSIRKPNNLDKNSCEGHITEAECINALKNMKNQKSPGFDGITVEFYKLFWNDVKEFYINSINYSFQTGSLTDLQKQSIIRLLPKQNTDITSLENWRTISLLKVDYKIATKAIANRVKGVISSLVNNSQTGFIKGRYIGENIRLLFEIIDNAEDENKPGLIFFSDFEKSFR